MSSDSEIWPIHFQAKSDELLSSWLARLAMAYSMSYFAFTQAIVEFASSSKVVRNYRKDWDSFVSLEALHFVANVTATPVQSIEGAMLTPPSSAGVVLSPYWFLSASAIQYCPSCLAEDQVPYFRREWRLAFITCCETHGSFLVDSCPACGASISCIQPRKEQEDGDVYLALRYCYGCKEDLSNKQPIPSPSIIDLEFQQQLRRVIRQGRIDLPCGYRVEADNYFAGIQAVTQRLTVGKSALALQQAFVKELTSDQLLQDELPIVSRQINRLNLKHRCIILNLLWRLIKAWPATSVHCANSAITYNKFLFREEQLLNQELHRAFVQTESDVAKQFT